MAAFFAGAVAYHAFVLLLLTSTPVDRQAGKLLLLNTPVLAAWGTAIAFHTSAGMWLGFGACGMQCIIAAITVARGIGDVEAVFVFDGIIFVALMAITFVCWRYGPHGAWAERRSEGDSPPIG